VETLLNNEEFMNKAMDKIKLAINKVINQNLNNLKKTR
jgi:hypothetical protein